jgi:hypothetical protein
VRTILTTGLAAAAVAAAACGGASASARSGLYGRVMLSPATPVCSASTPCTKPLANFELVLSRDGRRAARVRTDSHGRYRVALAPGVYTVAPAHARTIGRGLDPTHVRVLAGRFRRVEFAYDSGIR